MQVRHYMTAAAAETHPDEPVVAAARLMRAKLEEMKDLRVCGTVVSLRSALGPANEAQMEALSAELCAE